MNADAPSPATTGTAGIFRARTPSQVARAYFALAGGFWGGSQRLVAWGLTIGVIVFVLGNLGAALGLNAWNRYFFDALDKRDTSNVVAGLFLVLGLVFASAFASVGLVHMRMRLQLRWRQWLTRRMIGRWLADRRFYQLNIVETEATNPEFRIADDVRLAVEPLVDFIIGLTNAFLAAVAFISVLFVVGGSLTTDFFGPTITIPAYMVLGAIFYSTVTSLAMVLIGRPLIARVEAKNAGEARFRYELTRVRDSAESIALIGGDDEERERLDTTFTQLASRWVAVIVQQARMTWVGNANAVLAPVFPLILGAPKYLSGAMTLGELMQVATAFVQVQIALNWLVDNAIRLAEWLASAQRVVQLSDALHLLDRRLGSGSDQATVVLGESPDDALHLRELTIRQQNGVLMIDDTDFVVQRGEKVLVRGESGTGKSTLIRAMAGLWPWGSGEILRPKNARIAFMPQQPYIPLGTLRQAVLYPFGAPDTPDAPIHEALRRCGLGHLIDRLDDAESWDQVLSGGEKQRLAFARLIVDPPDIIIMDEATSALDEVSQATMLELLRTDLAEATVLNVAHRPGVEEYHDRELNLVRHQGGHAVTEQRHYPRLRKVFERLMRGASEDAPPPP